MNTFKVLLATAYSEFLVQYIPYNVSVTAYTSAGEGPEVMETAFTKEGGTP